MIVPSHEPGRWQIGGARCAGRHGRRCSRSVVGRPRRSSKIIDRPERSKKSKSSKRSKKMRSCGDMRSIVKFCNVLVFLQKITKKNNCRIFLLSVSQCLCWSRPKFPAPRVYDFAASCLQWVSCHLRPHNFTTGSGTACHAIPQEFVYRISQVNRYIYICI